MLDDGILLHGLKVLPAELGPIAQQSAPASPKLHRTSFFLIKMARLVPPISLVSGRFIQISYTLAQAGEVPECYNPFIGEYLRFRSQET